MVLISGITIAQNTDQNRIPFQRIQMSNLTNMDNGDSLNTEIAGRWAYGPCKALTVSGTHAYCSNGGYLDIVDISVSPPSSDGKVALPEPLYNVVVSGNYAYVANGESGLRIIDISVPANASEVGYYNTDGTTYDVVFAADTVYVADGEGGLKVIDVSNKSAPTLAGLYTTGGIARSIDFCNYNVEGKHVLVSYYSDNHVQSDDGVRIFNVTDAGSISQPGNIFQTKDKAWDFVIGIRGRSASPDDTLAFVADADSGLLMIDISDPTNFTLADTSYDTTFAVQSVDYFTTVTDTLVLLSAGDKGLLIVDVSLASPVSPDRKGYLDTNGNTSGVADDGTDAFIADGLKGLKVIDVSTPASPSLSDTYPTGGTTRDVAVSIVGAITDTLAYIADPDSGLRIIDVTDPTNANQIGFYDTQGIPYGVDVLGNYVYVADGVHGLRIIDISTPAVPAEAGFYDTDEAHAVFVSDTIAYVADYNGGLRLIDVSNPNNPAEVGSYNPGSFVRDVVVFGNYAYITVGYTGMRVVNISNPSSPSLVGQFNSGTELYGIDVMGNYVYLADGTTGLRVIDISTPSSPSQVVAVSTTGSAHDVKVSGNYAYVASGTGGLRIFNISDPSNPLEVGYYDTGDFGYGVCVLGHLAFLADDEDGLYIIDNTLAYVTHFTIVAPTGKSIPVVIQNALIDGDPIEAGDEIAIFDGDTCVGGTTYRGISPFNITVWMRYIYEDDTLKGAVSGDRMIFKIWDKSEDDTLGAYPTYTTGDGVFSETQMLTVVNPLEAYRYKQFEPVDPTGNSQLVEIYNVTINDDPIEIGDEIGVFDDNLCVGVKEYAGSYPIQIPVWLEQILPNNQILPGAQLDHSMSFKVWHDKTGFLAEPTYGAGSIGKFGEGVTKVDLLRAVTSTTQLIPIKPSKINLISFNTWPIDSVDRRISALLDDIGTLLVCQDDEGNYFLPGTDTLNTITKVDFSNGYQIFYDASVNDTIINEGFVLRPDTISISLTTTKYYMVTYPFQIGHDVTQVFSSISSAVVVVQDDDGNFWIPDYSVNDINDMVPGKGYQIYVKQNVNFTYPNLPNGLGKAVAPTGIKKNTKQIDKKHFNYKVTGLSYPVVITGSETELRKGDEIGLFAEELCVGSKTFSGEYPFAIAAWRKVDRENINYPGFEKGQTISIKVWRKSGEKEFDIPITSQQDSQLQYGNGPLSVIMLGKSLGENALPESFELEQNFPNPFNPETSISYQLPEAGKVSLMIYNTLGQEIRTLVNEKKQAGEFTIQWNGCDNNGIRVGSGIYFIRMKINNVVKIRKMLLVQ